MWLRTAWSLKTKRAAISLLVSPVGHQRHHLKLSHRKRIARRSTHRPALDPLNDPLRTGRIEEGFFAVQCLSCRQESAGGYRRSSRDRCAYSAFRARSCSGTSHS